MSRSTPHAAVAALFLLGCGAPPSGRATPAAPLPSAEEVALREQTADQQVKQAVSRLTFGARPGLLDSVRAMGVDRWIARQLEPERIDDRATDHFVSAHFPAAVEDASQLLAEYPPPQLLRRQLKPGTLDADDSAQLRRVAQQSRRVVVELQGAKVARAEMSERQLQEMMVDFWENHFSVFAGKGPERYLLAPYERDAIRPHALGKFRDLLESVAKSPAMLFYLDNWESTGDSLHPRLAPNGRLLPQRRAGRGLNENYGRELLELHTLGVDGGYTQQDVIAVARAFTGWTINRPRQGGGFVFRPAMHDAGEKIVLGHRLPAGRGLEDGEQVLDILARHPSTAHFIATKLVRRFVSDSAPASLVDRVAATFARTDGDIRECLRTIFVSPEFFSRAAYKSKVKSPLELVVSAVRAVGAPADSTPRTAQVIARLGEPLYAHRDPNGYPDVADAWINTGSILERINFGLALAGGRIPGASAARLAQRVGADHSPRAQQVDAVVQTILLGEATPDTRRVLVNGVNPLLGARLAPTGALADSAAADDTGRAAPRRAAHRDPLATGPALEGFAQIVGLALGAPEFQRR